MDRYFGIDAHLQSCTVCGAVGPVPQGAACRDERPGAEGLSALDCREEHVCFEEGELSEWLYEVVMPLGKSVMVVQPERLDRRSGAAGADTHQEQAGEGVVYKAPGVFGGLKEAVRAHTTISRDVARSKNRLRAVFRTRGIHGRGRPARARTGLSNRQASGVSARHRPSSCLADRGDGGHAAQVSHQASVLGLLRPGSGEPRRGAGNEPDHPMQGCYRRTWRSALDISPTRSASPRSLSSWPTP
jgi:hypothetical protein